MMNDPGLLVSPPGLNCGRLDDAGVMIETTMSTELKTVCWHIDESYPGRALVLMVLDLPEQWIILRPSSSSN
jgi:hypothetical protein